MLWPKISFRNPLKADNISKPSGMSKNVPRAVENIGGGPGRHLITFSRKMGSEIAKRVANQLN
jgi:hypothetical protein